MDKVAIRALYKQRRNGLSEESIHQLSLKIADQLISLISASTQTIHIFLPIVRFREINTYLIKERISSERSDISWIISKSDFNKNEMLNIKWTDELRISENSYGIPEPEFGAIVPDSAIDLVLVPLLAFDKKGHRLGYGKGFYDRFLSQCRQDCITIGLSYFDAHDTDLPSDNWDIPLQFCVTPDKSYTF